MSRLPACHFTAYKGFSITTSDTKTRSNFLNLALRVVSLQTEIKVLTGIYRKDQVFFRSPVQLHRVPSFHSVMPDFYKFNIVHSQVVLYSRLCNHHQAFVQAVAVLLHQFQQAGYPMPAVWKRLSSSLCKIPALYGCTAATIFKRVYAVYGHASVAPPL